MSKFEFRFLVKDMSGIWKNNKEPIQVDNTIFHYDAHQNHYATLTVESKDRTEALSMAKNLVNISLSKICFSYGSEAQLVEEGYTVTDFSICPHVAHTSRSLTIRYSVLGWEPEKMLKKIGSLPKEKMNVLELALLYLKLSSHGNPLRIESLFASITIIIRDLYPEKIGRKVRGRFDPEYVSGKILKDAIKDVLKREEQFDETLFENEWEECYSYERCSIAHGKRSTILDIARKHESEKLVGKVYTWAAKIILSYIERSSGTKAYRIGR